MRTPPGIAILLFAGLLPVVFAQSIGPAYGSREPRTCKSMKDPARGAPSPYQARQYVVCLQEGVMGHNLYLLENVKVEVGGSVPFSSVTDRGLTHVDLNQPIFPIRGSFQQYQCETSNNFNRGRNCTSYSNARAAGYCYKTTFGDWSCKMADFSSSDNPSLHVPPPQ